MLSRVMKLKVFYFSFINLLVALAVNSANASPSDDFKYLIQSKKAYKAGDCYKSDYLIARHLGHEYANQFNKTL